MVDLNGVLNIKVFCHYNSSVLQNLTTLQIYLFVDLKPLFASLHNSEYVKERT